jgi:hypothetical protein
MAFREVVIQPQGESGSIDTWVLQVVRGRKLVNANLAHLSDEDLPKREVEAYARLFAAAPDLLEACKLAHDVATNKGRMTAAQMRLGLAMVAGALEATIKKAEEGPRGEVV